MLGPHPAANKFVADMDRMPDAGGEAYGFPALAILVPMRNDIAD
jgi:hypothetical protein